jgi:acyl carrier protein
LPDGTIEFLGRIDHQVKVRGFRIELGEIEATLDQHPAVQQAVVLARQQADDDKQLVAYVIPQGGDSLKSSNLRSFLKKKLPPYMVPSNFTFLEAFPLTPSGKVNRRQLPTPDKSRSGLGSDFVAPRSAVEEMLANMWAEVLEQKQIGVYDNFFELGGHSLLATQLVSRIRQTFQVSLPLQTIFTAPTVADLCQTLVSHEQQPGQTEKIARALKRLQTMTDAEVQAMLQKKETTRGQL